MSYAVMCDDLYITHAPAGRRAATDACRSYVTDKREKARKFKYITHAQFIVRDDPTLRIVELI